MVRARAATVGVVDDEHQGLSRRHVIQQRGDGRGHLAGEQLPGQVAVVVRQQDVIEDPDVPHQACGHQLGPAQRDPQRREQAAPAPVTSLAAVERHPLGPEVGRMGGQDLDQQAGLADAGGPRTQRDPAPSLPHPVEEAAELGHFAVATVESPRAGGRRRPAGGGPQPALLGEPDESLDPGQPGIVKPRAGPPLRHHGASRRYTELVEGRDHPGQPRPRVGDGTSGGLAASGPGGRRAMAPGRGLERVAAGPLEAQGVGQQADGFLARLPDQPAFEVADGPLAEPGRLREVVLRHPSARSLLLEQHGEGDVGLPCHHHLRANTTSAGPIPALACA